MLLSLAIRDFVIVDTLELDFAAGFTVLTGETGAGKSIIIDALSLLQLRALRTLRAGEVSEAELPGWQRLLLLSVSGVSAGLQNTG